MKVFMQLALGMTMVLGGFSYVQAAQEKLGTGNLPKLTVNEAITEPKAGTPVTLKGQLVEDLGASSYTFRDETGDINVRITPGMIAGSLAKSSKVEIVGTLVTPKAQEPHVDVGMLTVTKTAEPEIPNQSVTE